MDDIKLENILWDELINFNKNTPLKKRSIIVVSLDDTLDRKYNAIVVKYDSQKNVHIRYLDDPTNNIKYWWTGNINGIPGLNPLSYHCKYIGDSYNEMEGLKKKDFVKDGYDDIINYDKHKERFFKKTHIYPFMNGDMGNIHTNKYYISLFKKSLLINNIPNCILNSLSNKYIDNIYSKQIYKIQHIFDALISVLPIKSMDIIYKYNKENISKKKCLDDLSKLISYKLLFQNKDRYDIDKQSFIDFKNKFKTGFIYSDTGIKYYEDDYMEKMMNKFLLKIIPYLFNFNIKVYIYKNKNINIVDYYNDKNINIFYLIYYKDNIYYFY